MRLRSIAPKAALPNSFSFGVLRAPDRVDDVVDRQRLAVVELDALPNADQVLVGLLRLELLGQVQLDDALLVEAGESVERRDEPHDVRLRDDVLAVDEVRRAAGRGLAERAATLDLGGSECGLRERAERAARHDDPECCRSTENVLPRHAALDLAAECFVGRPHGRLPACRVRDLVEGLLRAIQLQCGAKDKRRASLNTRGREGCCRRGPRPCPASP